MEKFNESEIKYLAGLLDADGVLSFQFVDKACYLNLQLAASESIDKHGYIDSLSNKMGNVSIRTWEDKNWSPSHSWRLYRSKDINMFMPRVVKHMVIKGKHWNNLYNKWLEVKGRRLSDSEIDFLKEFSKQSRLDAGPIKSKNHPTWAWVAGYLDGDGCYSFRKHSNPETKNAMVLSIAAVCEEHDRVGIDLLYKAFGGSIRKEKNWIRWKRNLGAKDSSFAIRFLRRVCNHSRLKKWKIEQMLSYHNNRLQRLSKNNSTE